MSRDLRSRIKSLEKILRPKERIILVYVQDGESHKQAKARTLKEQKLTEGDLNPGDIIVIIDWKNSQAEE